MKIAISIPEKEKPKGPESPYFRALVAGGASAFGSIGPEAARSGGRNAARAHGADSPARARRARAPRARDRHQHGFAAGQNVMHQAHRRATHEEKGIQLAVFKRVGRHVRRAEGDGGADGGQLLE